MGQGSVVITGASAGIGEACALGFAKLSKPLVLGARRISKLEEVASACRAAGSPEVLVVPLDVRDEQSIAAFCEAAEKTRPEVLLNNAGLARGRDPILELRDQDVREMLDTNVLGQVRVTRRLVPGMAARGRGHVIMLGSYAAHGVYEGGSIYCGTKHFLRALTQTLRLELSGSGVRVTEIDPGLVETEFSVVRLGGEEKAKAVYQGFDPLTAADVADCVLWAATRPAHVNIGEIVLTPTAQASLTKVARKA
jgi:3-hydroxy acid dehydrogenase/malonic semialdehyde reductase